MVVVSLLNANETWFCKAYFNYNNASIVQARSKPIIMYAIYNKEEDPEKYLAKWYSKEMYMRTYEYALQPIIGPDLWDKTRNAKISPPKFNIMLGRLKKKKVNMVQDESNKTKKTKRLTKMGKTMTCSICKQPGHN
ncbi:hypothetical protein CXB51_009528 [Gossypium anomalum]|uniref:Uncharacterized protein n=1 Tax=Gossypium anomalum TaxID=47600 RepID=A0A8J6D785_9ROSI|nr:hypothetical protein CXB51_009528 [Gossypium anomalum]